MTHFEDCKFFLQDACANGPRCGYRHCEASRHTKRLCNRWAAGHTCDGRCNLRHPSAADIAALVASQTPARADPASAPGKLAAGTGPPPCRFYARGRCVKGALCPFFHGPTTTAAQAVTARASPAQAAHRAPGRSSAPSAPTSLRAAAAAARKASAAPLASTPVGGGAGASTELRTGQQEKGVDAGSGPNAVAGVDAHAAAKKRAASILQKHRLSRSQPAVEAGLRGGVAVGKDMVTQPRVKKMRTEHLSQRQSPPSTASPGEFLSPTAAAAPGGAEMEASSSKDTTEPSEEKGGRTVGNGGGAEERDYSSGAVQTSRSSVTKVGAPNQMEEAPACDGAVAHSPTEQEGRDQEQPPKPMEENPSARSATALTKSDGLFATEGNAAEATAAGK